MPAIATIELHDAIRVAFPQVPLVEVARAIEELRLLNRLHGGA